MELKNLIISMSSLMSITGSEKYSSTKLKELVGDVFDNYYTDKIGNHIFIKKCGRENAPKIMIDCHFDEIGMIVSGIKEGGFLSVVAVGGVDTRLLQSSEVTIYGKKTIYGVFASTPPHLSDPKNKTKLADIGELLIDTGYSKAELEEFCPVGTPVGYRGVYTELLNERIAGKAFDNKSCGACAAFGVEQVSKEELVGDIYLVFATREEIGGMGAVTAAYDINPDYALVLDVTHAWIPEMESKKVGELGSGVAISYSAVTNRELTKMVQSLCNDKNIPYTLVAEPNNTGTDANKIGTTRNGVPCVLVSLPIKNMHSANELLCMQDANWLACFVSEFIKSSEIAGRFAK